MCGIAGWVNWEKDLTREQEVLLAMTEKLAARGPDASGYWVSPRAALGHRRLIVVDPSGGGQPMLRQRGQNRYIITYNGELYNTAELRDSLQTRGYSFQSYSDTEALLLSYIEWGPACLEKLNGIFAFGIWDEGNQSLFLARDRLGVKPLFFAEGSSGLLFASELKALLAHPALPPEVGAEGLAEIFVLGPGRTPGHAVFRGLQELKPGHYLIYNRQGISVRPYWRLESRPHEDDLKTTAVKLQELLRDTVRRQLVSDVPISTLLSGGLDSSAVTAMAAQAYREAGKGSIRTFSVEYEGDERFFQANSFEPNSDAPWSQLVSRYLGTEHHKVVIDIPRLVKALEVALTARDLPGMADIDSSLYLFSREIKKAATVALSGEAADEIFGGYPWFRQLDGAGATFPWIRMTEAKLQLFSPDLIALIRPQEYLARRYQEALAEVPALPGEPPEEARLREIAYLSLTRFMPVLLERKDRMSMAVGLEVRVPYCDHRLVEYVWNIPWSMKRWGGQEKGILRQALRGILPEEVLSRRKSPYPKTHHPGYGSAVRQWLTELLTDPGSPLRPFLNPEFVNALLMNKDGTGNFDEPWFGQLMRGPQLLAYLIQVDIWLRKYRVRIV